MNLRRLKYFVKIVDIGSLTQAAEVLHIGQPALSQQVATLEREMDQQLLIRTKRGVTPTEAGKILYAHARTILRQCEQAQLAVHNVGQTLQGQVSIGLAPGTAASSVTMPLLQAVRAELPDVLVYLHEDSGATLNDKLLSGQLDMAVLYDRAPVAGLTSQPLIKEDLFLVGTRDCPGQSVDLASVAQMNLFLPRDYSAVRKRVDEAFSLRGHRQRHGRDGAAGIRRALACRFNQRLARAYHQPVDDAAALAQCLLPRAVNAAGAGRERYSAVTGGAPGAGKPRTAAGELTDIPQRNNRQLFIICDALRGTLTIASC